VDSDYNVRVSIVPTKTGKLTVITMLVKGIDCAYQDREVDSDYNVRVSIVPIKTGKWTVITMLGYRLCLPRQGSGEGLQC
jgi:type II secretory ATPase GspE/PulE/Tfp pilus assembly ATPase PilB-like protein